MGGLVPRKSSCQRTGEQMGRAVTQTDGQRAGRQVPPLMSMSGVATTADHALQTPAADLRPRPPPRSMPRGCSLPARADGVGHGSLARHQDASRVRLRGIRLLPARPGCCGSSLRSEHHAFRPCRPSVRWRDRRLPMPPPSISRASAVSSLAADQALGSRAPRLGLASLLPRNGRSASDRSERHAWLAALRATRSSCQSRRCGGSPLLSAWKTVISSMRLRNSGRKWPRSTSMTSALVFRTPRSAAPRASAVAG